MRSLGAWAIAAVILLLGGCAALTAGPGGGPAGAQVSAAPLDPYLVPEQLQTVGRYVVVLKNGASLNDRLALSSGLATPPTHVYTAVFQGFAGQLTPAEVKRLKADPRVRWVEPDGVCQMCADPPAFDPSELIPSRQASYSGTNTLDWGVNRIDADLNDIHGNGGAGGTGGAGVVVAVIDTGINLAHPDLINADSSPAVIASYNAIIPTRSGEDDQGHGSHCAGIIGARDNALGYVGTAPQCSLIAVKVLSYRGYGLWSWCIAGIDWCAANQAVYGIKVASMSLGGGGVFPPLEAAISAATATGITFCCAAGNNASDASSFIPGSYAGVICVSALAPGDVFANYSNYGSVVDVIAPGSNVWSTYKMGRYRQLSGTSMATPHVAGCCALWLDNHPTDGFAQVMAALLATGEYGNWPGDPRVPNEPLVNAENL